MVLSEGVPAEVLPPQPARTGLSGFLSSVVGYLERLTTYISYILNWVAVAGVVAMLALSVADIIGIKAFKWPIPGGIEMVGFLGVVVTGFAIAHTLILRGHIQVEFFVMKMSERVHAAVNSFVTLLGAGLFALLAWQSYRFARTLQTTGEVSMTQGIPFYPFVYAIAFCSIPVCLALLVQFLRSMMKAVGK